MSWRLCQKAMMTPRPDSQNARTRSAWSVRIRNVHPSVRIAAYPIGGSIESFSRVHIPCIPRYSLNVKLDSSQDTDD